MLALKIGYQILDKKSKEAANLLEKLSDDELKSIVRNYLSKKKDGPQFLEAIGAPIDSEIGRYCGAEVILTNRYGKDYVLRELHGLRKPETLIERLYFSLTGNLIKIKNERR